jgi:hypothetical protein
MMPGATKMHEIEDDLRRERENSNRLAAALEMLVRSINQDDSTMHVVVSYPKAEFQLTAGMVIDGALACHRATVKDRGEI